MEVTGCLSDLFLVQIVFPFLIFNGILDARQGVEGVNMGTGICPFFSLVDYCVREWDLGQNLEAGI